MLRHKVTAEACGGGRRRLVGGGGGSGKCY